MHLDRSERADDPARGQRVGRDCRACGIRGFREPGEDQNHGDESVHGRFPDERGPRRLLKTQSGRVR